MFENKTIYEITAMLESEPQLKHEVAATMELFKTYNSLSARGKGAVIRFVEEKGWQELADAFRTIAKDKKQWVIEEKQDSVSEMCVYIDERKISLRYKDEDELAAMLDKAKPWVQEGE